MMGGLDINGRPVVLRTDAERLGRQEEYQQQQQEAINAILRRIHALESRQAAGNPLQAFDDDHLDAAPLLAEVARLTAENRELRDRLEDVRRNAEATVLVTKMAFGIQG